MTTINENVKESRNRIIRIALAGAMCFVGTITILIAESLANITVTHLANQVILIGAGIYIMYKCGWLSGVA
jgi:hypothetical protein